MRKDLGQIHTRLKVSEKFDEKISGQDLQPDLILKVESLCLDISASQKKSLPLDMSSKGSTCD